MTDEYLSGLFDGEGCVSASYCIRPNGAKNHRLTVTVGICNEAVPRAFQLRFGGSVTRRDTASGRPHWVWRVGGTKSRLALTVFSEHCVVKRPQAEVGLQIVAMIEATKSRGNRHSITSVEDKQRRDLTTNLSSMNFGRK